MSTRPDIPKKFAARIRAAQSKLLSSIESNVWDGIEIPALEEKLEAFDRDPDGWSAKHYPRHCKNSYPVQTHISRARAELMRKLERRPQKLNRLHNEQAHLKETEEEILELVGSMRPSSGRVPWPSPVQSIEEVAREFAREEALSKARAEAEHARVNAEEIAAENAEKAKREAEENAAIRRHVDKGPEHVLRHCMRANAVKIAFDAYCSSTEYEDANRSYFGGGLAKFSESEQLIAAATSGIQEAEIEISKAKSEGINLWDVCRKFGFYSPESVSQLDKCHD